MVTKEIKFSLFPCDRTMDARVFYNDVGVYIVSDEWLR
jgi:hypothetical protein